MNPPKTDAKRAPLRLRNTVQWETMFQRPQESRGDAGCGVAEEGQRPIATLINLNPVDLGIYPEPIAARLRKALSTCGIQVVAYIPIESYSRRTKVHR